jgi:16S rRNA (uracil1498-N3)-methyltransferase
MKEVRFFYVPDAASREELPDEEAMHALRVLRLKSGDEIMLMDGCGTYYRAEITLAATRRCTYRITETLPQEPQWHGHLQIAMAPTKMMDRVEWFAEKVTEIGIDELSFINCQFSERKLLRTARLEKIVTAAVKQSRKSCKPTLNQMVSFKLFIEQPLHGRKFICHCYDDDIPSPFMFDELQKAAADNSDDITVLIGPEGDFSIDEVHRAISHGYEPVSLGASRMRTETAGIAAALLMQLARRVR